MEDINTLLDLPSPSHSLHYVYGDGEQYLDAGGFDSQSSQGSPYDMSSYSPELGHSTTVYPSPEHEEDESTPNGGSQAKPAPKRKRENRYKNAPPSVLSRRRAQNRASQRAYRERKDQRIKDLETMLGDAKNRNEVLTQAYAALHSEYVQLKASQLKDQHAYPADVATFDPNMGMANNDRLDMDMFVYSDMSGAYTL